jgi:ferredoxin--NADP+ reductase
VVLACGAPQARVLGIPGESLTGSLSAAAFTGWYNGHPDCAGVAPPLDAREVVLIGQGNVALDVARMLVVDPACLRSTDMPDAVVAALETSAVRTVHMVGRRGPAEVSFSAEELEALAGVEGCGLLLPADALAGTEGGAEGHRDVLALMRRLAGATPAAPRRRVVFHFLRSPREVLGTSRVEGVVLETNRLSGGPGCRRPEPTGASASLPCGLIVGCIGFRGEPLPGVPFDEAGGIVPSRAGRVPGGPGPGLLYVAGWLKHGPRGLIGTARRDAGETAGNLLRDLANEGLPPVRGAAALFSLLQARGCRLTTLEDWLRIDDLERRAGAAKGKPREKMLSVAAMLGLAS